MNFYATNTEVPSDIQFSFCLLTFRLSRQRYLCSVEVYCRMPGCYNYSRNKQKIMCRMVLFYPLLCRLNANMAEAWQEIHMAQTTFFQRHLFVRWKTLREREQCLVTIKCFFFSPCFHASNCTDNTSFDTGHSSKTLTLYSIDTHFDASTTAFENIVGKEEIARNEQFLLFPTMFSTQSDNCIPICA